MSDPQKAAASLRASRDDLAQAIVKAHYDQQPQLEERYGPQGRARCLEDASYHLDYLANALATDEAAVFTAYVAWAKVLLAGLGIPPEDLVGNLRVMRQTVADRLGDIAAPAVAYIDTALEQLPAMASESPSHIPAEGPLAELARLYLKSLLDGDEPHTVNLVLNALDQGTSVGDLYLGVFVPTQHEIGRLWQMNQISVADEHFCSAATQRIMGRIQPYIAPRAGKNGRRVVVACGVGEQHEIGARMLSDFFELDGWRSFFLGATLPVRSLLDALARHRPHILALSLTNPAHLALFVEVIAVIKEQADPPPKIMVGGYAFLKTPDLWRRIGADATASSADEALAEAKKLVR